MRGSLKHIDFMQRQNYVQNMNKPFVINARSAFTLVELSIVLVILGLLVGGVLTGQSLIRAAELRSVSVDYTKYVTAVNTFKDKYLALPGDMPNAVRYWGSAHGSAPADLADGYSADCDAITVPSTDSTTCNGNGDGFIDGTNSNTETFRFWQHLSTAGLIEGNFGGVVTASNESINIGIDVPKSRISNAGWAVWEWGNPSLSAYNALFFGAAQTGDERALYTPVIKAEDAFNIDGKIDDGKPHTGRVISGWAGNDHAVSYRANCVAANNTEYLLANTTKGCGLIFELGL